MQRVLACVALALLAACARQETGDRNQAALASGAEVANPGVMPAGAAGAAPAARPAAGPPRNALRFEPAVIVDASGFDRPMGAITLFVPHGWRTQGGVEWGQQHLCTNGYAIKWAAFAPDGSASIAVLPQTGWFMNSYGAGASTPGCQPASYTTVRQYLEVLLARWLQGARILDYRPREDVRATLAQLESVTPMPAGQVRNWVEAGEVLFAFQANGRDMRGTLAAAVLFSHTRSDYGMGPMDSLTASAFPAYGATALNGQLNFGLAEAIRRSIKTNPQWEQRIAGHNQRIGQVAIEENRKRAAMISQTNEEISRIRQETWSAYQESADRRAREFGEAIRGVETYNDPQSATGTVELSHLYDHAWRLTDGSYVLTNDPNFEPYRDLRLDGQRLEVTR